LLKTQIIRLDPGNIDMDKLKAAAEVLRSGGLVAFPTETVYGLGANALDSGAVARIYQAKGRPSDNPLIVHIADKEKVRELVTCIPDSAGRLMDAFWPGPLTLVMPRAAVVSDAVTAGLETVAVRMPLHPVALALIREAGVPVAAPSANTSGRPSPTSAQHVIEDLMGRVDVIIDAGPAAVGLESTVLDVTSEPAVILRPGGITPRQVEELLGAVQIDPALMSGMSESAVPRSPGMKYTHYSPKADVIIVEGSAEEVAEKIAQLVEEYRCKGTEAGIMSTDQTRHLYKTGYVISMGDRERPETIGANLFRCLREFDEKRVDVILAEAVESTGIGLAIMNRMCKAAGNMIIRVE
jgi:L-threonylcarbamoyladenylate synthase